MKLNIVCSGIQWSSCSNVANPRGARRDGQMRELGSWKGRLSGKKGGKGESEKKNGWLEKGSRRGSGVVRWGVKRVKGWGVKKAIFFALVTQLTQYDPNKKGKAAITAVVSASLCVFMEKNL